MNIGAVRVGERDCVVGDAVGEVDGCLQERWGGRGCFGVSVEKRGGLRQG